MEVSFNMHLNLFPLLLESFMQSDGFDLIWFVVI
jgi:hypothetical protein